MIQNELGAKPTIITVESKEDSLKVQKHLFSLGCSFIGNSTVPEQDFDVLAILVSPSGSLTVFIRNSDESSIEESPFPVFDSAELFNANLELAAKRIQENRSKRDKLFKAKSQFNDLRLMDMSALTDEQIDLISRLHASFNIKL